MCLQISLNSRVAGTLRHNGFGVKWYNISYFASAGALGITLSQLSFNIITASTYSDGLRHSCGQIRR